MFLTSKYKIWYEQLISRALSRDKPSISERHHIIPKSLGGVNHYSNLAFLTPREHFIAHLLLVRMTDGAAKYKMTAAICLMIKNTSLKLNRSYITSRHYDMRVAFSRVSFSAEHRAKLSEKAKSRPKQIKSEKTKELHRLSMIGKNLGKTLSMDSRKKISDTKRGVTIGPHSEDRKSKIAFANTGKRQTLETKYKLGKKWSIIKPDGSIIKITALKTFCSENHLNYTSLMNTLLTKKPITRGSCKGWMILKKHDD